MGRFIALFLTFLGTISIVCSASAVSMCRELYSERFLMDESSSGMSWGQLAFAKDLKPVSEFFSAQSGLTPEQIVDAVLKSGLRPIMFRLQSTAKIYSEQDAAFFGELRAEFKSIEDKMGAVSLAQDLKKKASKLGDQDVIQKFVDQEIAARAELREVLEKTGWLQDPSGASRRLSKKLNDYRGWQSATKDRKFILGELTKSARKLQEDSREMKFDKNDIEKGLHELRRRLRWVIVQVQSFDGFVAHDHSKMHGKLQDWYDELALSNPKLLESKYVLLGEPIVENPVMVPKKLHAALGEVVEVIGKLKDKAEMQIYIDKVISESSLTGEKRAELRKKLQADLGVESDFDHRQLSVDFMKRLNKTKLLEEFAKQMEEMN